MVTWKTRGLAGCFAVLVLAGPVLAQRPDPNAANVRTVRALAQILEQAADVTGESVDALVNPENREALLDAILKIRALVRDADGVDVRLNSPTSGQLVYALGQRTLTVDFELTGIDPCHLKSLNVAQATGDSGDTPPPLAWETLEQQLDEAAAQMNLDGAVLIVRDGQIVLHKAWGMANREKKIANRPDTIFAIGSAPIDFTHAGILLLADQGKLNLDDPITRFFDNVPEDKQSITIRHLMTGGSGLPDFHDLPGDENPDHTWIDRDEAVRRMLAQKLLFAPGTGEEHSHSAWGMLAAVIEVVSGQTYQEFSRENLYGPAGLTDTGFFGDPLPEPRVAVGYGVRKSSEPNSPPHWGKTSWLVMGSGGQVSTLTDIHRWAVAMRSGKILSPESTRLYVGDGDQVSVDGDMFGFEFMHSHKPQRMFLFISNSVDSPEQLPQFFPAGRPNRRTGSGCRTGHPIFPGYFDGGGSGPGCDDRPGHRGKCRGTGRLAGR